MNDYKLVPVEPTPEMLAEIHIHEAFTQPELRARYQAMLAAAPAVQGELVAYTVMVPFRNDLIQCLLATRGQSEGATADAILSILTYPQPAEQQSITGVGCEGCEGALALENSPCTVCGWRPETGVTRLAEALELALEYWRDRQQRYKNRRPKWVIAAESALATHRKQERQ